MKKLIGSIAIITIGLFSLNLYKYKVQQKPENKEKIEKTLKDVGVDDDTLHAIDDTVTTINETADTIGKAKKLIADVVESDMVKSITGSEKKKNEDSSSEQKTPDISNTNKVNETIDTAKRIVEDEQFRKEIRDEVTTEIENRADELPYLTDQDIDDIVDRVADRLQNSVSDEAIDYYFKNRDLEEFNGKLTNEVTNEKYGFIANFMKKWIDHMPDINDANPIKE